MVNRAVAAVVNYEGKILLGKKRKDSPKVLAGEWHIPGETVEGNESDEEALLRGVLEEANLKIKVGRYLGSGISPTSQREVRWYECFSETEEIDPGSDLEDIKWVSRSEILNSCGPEEIERWPPEILEYFK